MLFVCTGNSFRSIIAESVLRAEAARLGLVEIKVASGGVRVNGDPDRTAREQALKDIGLPLEPHTPHQLTPDLVAWADLIIGFETWHISAISDFEVESKQARMLGEWLTTDKEGGTREIADPHTSGDYGLATLDIIRAVEALVLEYPQA